MPGKSGHNRLTNDHRAAALTVAFWLLLAAPAIAEDTVGLVDPATGIWYLRDDAGEVTSFFYGNPSDSPMMGDWDCDGVTTPGLYRRSTGNVYLRNSNTPGIADIKFVFGNPGDIPLAGDFDGDGCDTVSIYRPSEGKVYIVNDLGANDGSLGPAEFSYYFGIPGDKPFVGDFNDDEVDTIGLHRMGQRFRLKAAFDTSGFSWEARVILEAMKTYGLILADNGSPWYISGAPDPRWDNDILHELDVLDGSDFEAVDVSSLMVDPNSGQAAP